MRPFEVAKSHHVEYRESVDLSPSWLLRCVHMCLCPILLPSLACTGVFQDLVYLLDLFLSCLLTVWPIPVTCLFNKCVFTIIINKYVGQGSSEDRALWQTTEDHPPSPTCALGMVIQLLVSQPIQPIISRSWPSRGITANLVELGCLQPDSQTQGPGK